ncbi:MAG: SURF1 family protein [Proteobacteria bacterium]|nr:SURF1 family protein [Pseudomonadota bacterium]
MRFRPQFWPTVVTVPMLIALIGLSIWQFNRYGWKADLIEKLDTRAESAAIDLPPAGAITEALEFQRVRVAGTYLHDKEFHLVARSLRGNPGVHIFTPLRRADGSGIELINRGWVPGDRLDASTREPGQLAGAVTVEGIIRLDKGQGNFIPDNDPKKNVWFFVDSKAMAQAAGLDALPPYYIVSGNTDVPGGFPVGRQWRINLPNNHLEYALTWLFMAMALLVIYVVYHRKPR